MSEEDLIRNCAPTLAGLKTASLFTCSCADREALFPALQQFNRRFAPKGLRLLPLRFSPDKVLLYLYRPDRLRRDLTRESAAELLLCRGYDPAQCDHCLARLRRKLREEEEFPHEIGLFLGYPAEDVRGFLKYGPDCAKCSGCWKVYGDVDAAQKTFDKYKKCTRIYQDRWALTKDLERLTVPTRIQ